MNDSPEYPEASEDRPKATATVKRAKWRFPVVWVVPVVTALVAGYLIYDRVRELGPEIRIRFKDAGGLKPGQTPIRYRGVQIGEVTEVELTDDRQHALVTARLRRSAVSIAREGTAFWIVRPEVGIGNITGLGTVITGPHVEALPGAGEPKAEFVGLESPPVAPERKGLRIVLLSGHVRSLKPGSPVFYRGIEVGAVRECRLGADATAVKIHLSIQQRYAKLVRKGSKFWDVSGVDVSIGLLRGMEINVESLRSLVAGGIAFATPDNPGGGPAKDGAVFPLHDKPEKEWLAWTPSIPIPPEREGAAR